MHDVTLFLNAQPAWHWWALGAILLAVEITSAGICATSPSPTVSSV